jgi:hypothetical protein
MVDELRELGFLEDQARKAPSQSNNNLAAATDILMKPLDNTNSVQSTCHVFEVEGAWWIHIHTTSQT